MLELLPAPPADPLWDLTAEYGADPRPERLNLVLGVYRDQSGVTPVMRAVRDAEIRLAERSPSKEYRGLSGNTAFNQAMLETVLGDEALVARSTAVQTVAGTGALRLLADLVRQTRPGTTVWVSDPAYVNHRPILEAAGLAVRPYRWTDPDGLLTDLALAGRDDVVLVQGCCHNPTGVDPTREQWEALAALAAHAGWVPFVDLAYHGLGDGLEADLWAVRMLAERLPELLVAVSCSKNFGLYADRTGCAIVLGSSGRRCGTWRRLCRTRPGPCTRCRPSTAPRSWRPSSGPGAARLVAGRAGRDAVPDRREPRRAGGRAGGAGPRRRRRALARQKGMFAGLPLGPGQMAALRRDHAVYGTSSGRINIAGLPRTACRSWRGGSRRCWSRSASEPPAAALRTGPADRCVREPVPPGPPGGAAACALLPLRHGSGRCLTRPEAGTRGRMHRDTDTAIEAARRALVSERVYVMPPADVLAYTHADSRGWDGFAAHWDELRPDPYAAEGGTRRLRRYGRFSLEPGTGEFVPRPHDGFLQPERSNALYADTDRHFAPLTGDFTADPVFRAVVRLLDEVAAAWTGPQSGRCTCTRSGWWRTAGRTAGPHRRPPPRRGDARVVAAGLPAERGGRRERGLPPRRDGAADGDARRAGHAAAR